MSVVSRSRHTERSVTEAEKTKPRPKHPIKVHVWGGISMRGATCVVIFSGIMTAIRYTEILELSLVAFIRDVFAASLHRLNLLVDCNLVSLAG